MFINQRLESRVLLLFNPRLGGGGRRGPGRHLANEVLASVVHSKDTKPSIFPVSHDLSSLELQRIALTERHLRDLSLDTILDTIPPDFQESVAFSWRGP